MAHIGYVDGYSRGQIRGWAIDLQAPGTRVVVRAEASRGMPWRQTLADRYRADVHKQGIGDGYCGFAIPVKWFSPGERVRFFCGGTRHELGRILIGKARPKATSFRKGSLVISLDRSSPAGGVTGWALDRLDLGQRRRLLLCANGRILATQRATLFREDSLPEGGDGLHGFSLPAVAAVPGLAIVDSATGTSISLV